MSEAKHRVGKWVGLVLAFLCLAALGGMALYDSLPHGGAVHVPGYRAWDRQIVEEFSRLPIMDGGRVKPMSTHASYVMLELYGSRSMTVEGDTGKVKLGASEWMMDVLFRPQVAVKQPTFRVENSEVLLSLGVAVKNKRDRYRYEELMPGRDRLDEIADKILQVNEKERDLLQKQTLDLVERVRKYESYLGYFNFARQGLVLKGTAEAGGVDKRTDLSSFMEAAMNDEVRKQLDLARMGKTHLDARMYDILQQVGQVATYAKVGLSVLPPADPQDRTWKNAGDCMLNVVGNGSKDWQVAVQDVAAMEAMVRSVESDPNGEFGRRLSAFRQGIERRMEARGEGRRVGAEVWYQKKNLFLWSLVYYLMAMVVGFLMWTAGRNKIGKWATVGVWGFLLVGFCSSAIAIGVRCWIMGRPPVGNLYDTIVFIATAVVGLVLVLELVSRKRIALGFGPILGAALLVLARRFEMGDAKDHMDPLVAVLDSNYWLTTHVITITLGYAAGLLSAYLSVGYILIAALKLDGPKREIRQFLTRLVYGMICFTVLLSLIGTVLGGIWANDSWGRFWGWDPKENGALLIVLWTLAILHARLGGYLREWGLHLASVFTAVVIAFSWWHVNFLNVGLHNYGFTSGKMTIWAFYGVKMVMLAIGIYVWAREKGLHVQKETHSSGEE